ncbi:MAG: OadG family protein [Candidatus Marinimicrobia bacterium]|nr:OadG family protein [Candidatus Neomarinimicrobiota bacterium]
MIDNIIQNNGFNIALSGIIVVFAGLILIAVTIHLFNKVFERLHHRADKTATQADTYPPTSVKKVLQLADDELVAIATAIECYRKIHFESLQTQITFKRGEQQTVWKSGQKFGQRLNIIKRT